MNWNIINRELQQLIKGRNYVQPSGSESSTVNLRLLNLGVDLAPFQFYQDLGVVEKISENPSKKGLCLPAMDRLAFTTFVQIKYISTSDPIYDVVIRSHEEAEAAIALGKSCELREHLIKGGIPIDSINQVMPAGQTEYLDRLLLTGQACFALGLDLPPKYYCLAQEFLTLLRRMPYDQDKENFCNLATLVAVRNKGISDTEFSSWYEAKRTENLDIKHM